MIRAPRLRARPTRIVWLLIGSVSLTIGCFVASTLVAEQQAHGIAAAAESIATNALPSISCISGGRTELRQLGMVLERATDRIEPPADKATELAALDRARDTFTAHWNTCTRLPVYTGERGVQRSIGERAQVMNASIDEVIRSVQAGDHARALDELTARTLVAIEALDAQMVEDVEINARESTRRAAEIAALRASARSLSAILIGLSTILAIVAGAIMILVLHRFAELTEARVSEMEHFAGRVAHDIRSPLAALGLAIEMTKRDPRASIEKGVLDRAGRTLQQVDQLVDGLLVFARASAPPREPVQSDVNEVLDGVVDGLRPSAEANEIELTIDAPVAAAAVACTPGVLISMVSNIVGNAIKFMGSSPVRQVRIQTRDLGDQVRIEVRDTGPGVPAPQRERLFDPYVRGAASAIPGIGLGLATVRRLAEAHGGNVGFMPNAPSGSVFWFELPKARAQRETPARPRGVLLSRLGLRPSERGSP